jgi:hypothetical protein
MPLFFRSPKIGRPRHTDWHLARSRLNALGKAPAASCDRSQTHHAPPVRHGGPSGRGNFGLRRGRMFVDLMQSALGRWLSVLRRRHVGGTGDHSSASACLSVCRGTLPFLQTAYFRDGSTTTSFASKSIVIPARANSSCASSNWRCNSSSLSPTSLCSCSTIYLL